MIAAASSSQINFIRKFRLANLFGILILEVDLAEAQTRHCRQEWSQSCAQHKRENKHQHEVFHCEQKWDSKRLLKFRFEHKISEANAHSENLISFKIFLSIHHSDPTKSTAQNCKSTKWNSWPSHISALFHPSACGVPQPLPPSCHYLACSQHLFTCWESIVVLCLVMLNVLFPLSYHKSRFQCSNWRYPYPHGLTDHLVHIHNFDSFCMEKCPYKMSEHMEVPTKWTVCRPGSKISSLLK